MLTSGFLALFLLPLTQAYLFLLVSGPLLAGSTGESCDFGPVQWQGNSFMVPRRQAVHNITLLALFPPIPPGYTPV